MADNVQLNPGTGGDIAAADDVGGVKYQIVKFDLGGDGASIPVVDQMPSALFAAGAEYWPAYSGATDTGNLPLHVDPSGALITRGAVTTDEGTFRVNFANTSLAVSIGSVAVAGDIVTGSGFLAADVHYKDYFKLNADAESAWVGIASVDSDTQITLRTSYVGGSSGAASRALVRPVTGSGGAISVASGQCTMTTGTTINAITRIVRDMDFAPLIFRARLSFSQRIANQTFRIGMTEAFTTSDRWFARFKLDGTTNTTLVCESGRNPTTTPSAAETETTTVTIPFGLNTAALLDYRIEQLTESCRFFINGVLVAEHTRAIPSQHDEMEASVTCINGASAPASTTTVVVDYVTGKNHNKLEIGVMSDAEKVVASAVPLQQFSFTQAGVIAINTDLIVLDCSQIRSLMIQCNSMGTAGVVTAQWSNTADFAQPITATLLSEAGATSTTFNAAVLRATNVMARYCRLRLTTATTAGTTTLNVWGAQTTYTPIIPTQPVSGTVTATVTAGTINPVVPATPYFLNSAATTNGALIITGTSNVSSFYATNEGATVAYIKLYNKATAPTVGTDIPEMIIPVPAAVSGVPGVANPNIGFHGYRFALGLGIAITGAAVHTDTTAVAAGQVKVKISRAI
jgi:hypothetical protein